MTIAPRPCSPRHRQSLGAAVKAVRSGFYHAGMDGLPAGGWPETEQARRRLIDQLPPRDWRSYGVGDLIDALYVVSWDGRYHWKG